MHELSICASIVDSVLEELKNKKIAPNKLRKCGIVAGALRQIVPEFLKDAYKMTTNGTGLEDSEIVIEIAALTADCPDCGWSGELKELNYLCPACDSVLKLNNGTELYLSDLEYIT
ncbi:MAG: hydrogenase maturation nickel metallochaperone HypA [Kiritimatiellaeota bacterium]|nr:hydrogenase maturation nickel metallochaperone HypA [Kiritimatiellota bacterium]